MHSAPVPRLLRLTRIEYAAAGIHLFEFRDPDGGTLPSYEPGAHVDLHLANGGVRQYSLVDPAEAHPLTYVVGVKRDPNGRGGSAWLHDSLRVGQGVPVGGPRNNFRLDEAARRSVFIAGGIGITPIACMAQRLRALGREWSLHYCVRSRPDAAFIDRIAGGEVHLHASDEHHGVRLDLDAVVAGAPAGAVLYCCGPRPMLEAVEAAALRRGLPCHVEHFAGASAAARGASFAVTLSRRGVTFHVEPGQSIIAAMRASGVDHPTSCEEGVCGACEAAVLAGVPDHRDSILGAAERAGGKTMMLCCSGSLSSSLVLDL